MEGTDCCPARGRKSIDQLQGEFKASELSWNNAWSQVSPAASLALLTEEHSAASLAVVCTCDVHHLRQFPDW